MDTNPSDFFHPFDYWEVFLSWLFTYPSRCYALKKNAQRRVLENPSRSLKKLGRSYRSCSTSEGVICRFTSRQQDVRDTCRVLHQIYEEISSPELCDFATSEVLAKVLAYRKLHFGDQVSIPTLKFNQEMHLSNYVVEKVFDLWSQVRAFGFVSANGDQVAPLLLFRGTDLSFKNKGSKASIISDFDPKGPGRSLFENAHNDLHEWLKTVSSERGKVRVIGHSLGGAIVLYTLIHEHPFISNASHEISYAFNFPGVDEDLLRKWETLPDEAKPAFRGFICRGDVISKFGHLFGDVSEVSFRHPLPPIRAHEHLFFAEPMCYLYPLDVQEENSSSSHRFYSKLHKQTASMIYECGLKFLFPRQP